MKRKYSKIYCTTSNEHYGFRYNYENNALQWIFNEDMIWNESKNDYDVVILSDWEVASSIGLDLNNWNESPEYWVGKFQNDISEECACEMKYI